MTDVHDTLAERGSRYGEFAEHARIAQSLQDLIRSYPGWRRLDPDMRQSLTVMCDKFARMLNGDPKYRDNWHDIAGYATLIDERLAKDEAATQVVPDPYYAEVAEIPEEDHSVHYYDSSRNLDTFLTHKH